MALLSTALVASMLLVTGCGRTAINPVAPEEPGLEEPGEEPIEEPDFGDPFPYPDPGGDEPGGGGYEPVTPPAPGGGAAPAPAPNRPLRPQLKPISRPTPPPAMKDGGSGGGGPEPGEVRSQFMDLLERFGYTRASEFDVRMQLAPLTRVSAVRWVQDPQLGLLYGRRKGEFPGPISYQDWQQGGLELARRKDAVTFYVARWALYREVISNFYEQPQQEQRQLVFYKRLNRTNLLVCYGPDGTVLDYGYFPVLDRRMFIEVPGAFWK